MLTTSSEPQGTLGGTFEMADISLHTGEMANIRCHPAPPDHGIVFRRIDLGEDALIPARLDQVCMEALQRRTTLGNPEGASIATIEHLLSAFYGAGIDNALVDCDCEEMPIFDGSAQPFLAKIKLAGVERQNAKRRYLSYHEPVVFTHGNVEIVYTPSDEFRATVFVDYGVEHVGAQTFHLEPGTSYEQEIAPARTFCLFEEVEKLRKAGLIVGGTTDCAIVIHEDGYLNDDLRFPDEIVRHKTLDLIGDLMLLGHRLRGHVLANRAGHATHLGFGMKLLERIESDSPQ